jgi:hypothetical protein
MDQFPPRKGQTTRNEKQVYSLGVWRRYSSEPFITQQTQNKYSRQWISDNQQVIDIINSLFKENFPELYHRCNSQSIPERLLGAFTTAYINCDFAVSSHRDKFDLKDGYCFVTTFGNYTGGALNLETINETIELNPGDVIAFKSQDITHSVAHYIGERYSFVLFNDRLSIN